MASESWSSSTTAWIVLRLGIAEHARHLAGASASLREALRIGRPRHDVDALAAQLVHDGLHARALEPTHAPTGSIESSRENTAILVRLPTSRAAARISTMLLLDLRHLELEQRLHEQRIGAAQDEARALGRLLDALEHGADRLALVEVLAMVLLAIRNDRFRLAELVEHDDELAALDLLDFAREQVADAAANSSRICVRSPSRTRWMMRCLAACTAARPNSAKSTGSSITSPSWKSGSSKRASSSGDLRAGIRDRPRRPVLSTDDLDGALQLVDSTSACTFGPCFFASAAWMPSCSSPCSSERSSCFEFVSSRNAASISAELTSVDSLLTATRAAGKAAVPGRHCGPECCLDDRSAP